MATAEAQTQAYRDQVHWRSVTRADPYVEEIVKSCTFCSVFVFDKVADEWVKQKQEGPLFLVRRNKEPYYGLYMLNRATVKNPLWPLIPNEIRVTPTVDDMLIVERKGEGIKTGIHFADGKAKVEEFRSYIIGICGDPRAKAASAAPSAAPSQSQSQSQAPAQQKALAQSTSSSSKPPVDDLSRLFSNILSVPSSSSRPSSANQTQSPITINQVSSKQVGHSNGNGNIIQNQTDTYTSRPDENTYTHTQTTTYSSHRPGTPPSPPITFSELPVSPPKSPVNLHPPGQTVADLLNSIGGFSFPTTGPPPPQVPAHPLLSPSNNFPPTQAPAPAPPPSIPPHPLLPPTPPPPPVPAHPLLFNHIPPPQAMRTPPPPPPQVQAGPAPNAPLAQRPRDRPPHLDAPPIPSGHPAPAHPGISQIQGAILNTLPATYTPAGPDHRGAFQRDLIDMLQRDPVFVDQLFQAYLSRRS